MKIYIYIATYGKYMANIGITIGIRIWDHTGKIIYNGIINRRIMAFFYCENGMRSVT